VEYVALALRLTLAAVCLAAVVGKLRGRRSVRAFARMLADIGVPARLVAIVGAAVVVTELAVASLAPWPPTARVGSLLAAGLFAVLTAGVGQAVSRGSTATCQCFGGRGGRLGPGHAIRNAALTATAVLAAVAGGGAPGTHPVGWAGAVMLAALCSLVIVFWDDLIGPVATRKG
jgi:methylamine utilization protein MauE